MRVLSTVKFTLLRMLRNYIVLILLLIVPIILLSLFSFILKGSVTETGEPYINVQAVTMVLVFQLFGGSIVMSYIYYDFFTEHRKRLYSLPFNQTLYAFSIMICGTIYSILLGITLMLFTQFVLGVAWGNWFWAIYIITLMAMLSSIICLIFTFSVKNFKVAERLSEVYGVGFVILAGLFFPMPDNAFIDFVNTYVNPLTLSIISIYEMNNSNIIEALFPANILLIAMIILFILMLIIGKKKMI